MCFILQHGEKKKKGSGVPEDSRKDLKGNEEERKKETYDTPSFLCLFHAFNLRHSGSSRKEKRTFFWANAGDWPLGQNKKKGEVTAEKKCAAFPDTFVR